MLVGARFWRPAASLTRFAQTIGAKAQKLPAPIPMSARKNTFEHEFESGIPERSHVPAKSE
jgi:hypothetical protein